MGYQRRSRVAQELNVPRGYALPVRHCRLTDSPASTDVALIMLRAVDLAAALLDGLFEHPAGLLRLAHGGALSLLRGRP